MEYFQSGMGLYLLQATAHSAVAVVVVASVVKLWGITVPSLRLRFHLLALALPLLTPLTYAWLYPAWSRPEHRGWVLLESGQWLRLEPWGQPVFLYLLVLAMALGTALFLLQEVLPSLERRRYRPLRELLLGEAPELESALARLARAAGRPAPRVLVTGSAEPVAFVFGVLRPRLVVSRRLLDILDGEEIEGIAAHELAHLHRRDQGTGWLLLLLRLFTFYNPVALLAFRWMVQEAEQECDALAASWTGKPLALATGIIRVFREGEPLPQGQGGGFPQWVEAVNHGLHRSLVEDRVGRLADTASGQWPAHAWWRWLLTATALAGLLFTVV
ncbi:MAG: M56 family metallopeptidase [Chloroflexota bacterium]